MKSALTTNSKAIVSSKGQVVIPKRLREKLGIHAGNELIFKSCPNGSIEMKAVERSIDLFFGRCKRKQEAPISCEEIDQAIMQAVSKKD